MKKKIIPVIIIILLITAGCGKSIPVYLEKEPELETEAPDTEEILSLTEESEEKTEVYVYICGAVNVPGVYVVKRDSRIFEVIDLAGGLREDASVDTLNQAELVTDGQMLRILTVEEAETVSERFETEAVESEQDGKVNLNTASADVLMTLPGIGQSKAESIISYRETNGGFESIEDIKNITGIKDGVYTKIKDFITVN